ncbi:hypothetical protein CSW98_00815 [Vibrio sp. HA2012]|nr:hypothetical protein CSW98_00815 [Vibrio sp. HA2012]
MYGCKKTFSVSVLTLSDKCLSTRSVVVSLFKKLKSDGYVLVRSTRKWNKEGTGIAKGRGNNDYEFTQRLKETIEESPLSKMVFKNKNSAVDKVLYRKELKNGEKKVKLRSASRLFLLILLVHADEMGVVPNLSTAQISKLMGGLSRDRFKSQLATLLEMGIIRHQVSGCTGVALFGKVKSTYYLNVFHPLLTGWGSHVSRLSVRIEGISDGNTETEAKALFQRGPGNSARWPSVVKGYVDSVEIEKLGRFFRERRLEESFQRKLCEIASEMLSDSQSGCNGFTVSPESLHHFMPNELLSKKYAETLLSNFHSHLTKGASATKENINTEASVLETLEKEVKSTLTLGFNSYQIQGKADVGLLCSEYLQLVWLIKMLATRIAKRYWSFLQQALGRDFKLKRAAIVPRFKICSNTGEEYIGGYEILYIGSELNDESRDDELKIVENRFELCTSDGELNVLRKFRVHEDMEQIIKKMFLPA